MRDASLHRDRSPKRPARCVDDALAGRIAANRLTLIDLFGMIDHSPGENGPWTQG